ncbi:MAG: transcriptional repressor LexA [Candidatus Limnocylindrales bacterium]
MTKHDALRKQRIIDYIATTVRDSGYPPSVREIAAAVDLASTSAVHHHLSALEREGMLERDATQSRAIRLTPAALQSTDAGTDHLTRKAEPVTAAIPVIGEIAAGGPIEAYQDTTETVTVPDIINTSSGTYVLRVRGDSMVDAHIMDGDLVVIREQATAHDGDIVVAQVEENSVTLKRFFKERNRVRLQPANEAYEPQFYDDVRIQGKLVGVIRRVD